ncbi:MAG: preprotein translocase subunit SecE [Planctomycetia bacterium]|nr:preprotein translocase subunit SecE [Planctomycetia bacterium]
MQENAKTATIWGDVLSFSVYKRNQGRMTRQVTFAALALIVGLGIWRFAQLLAIWYGGGDTTLSSISGGATDIGVVRFLLPGVLLAAGLWLCFRIVNIPKFADFLIAVESEVAKVSWPTAEEVFRSSAVIIFLIFALAAILAGYDLFWWFVLRYVLRTS